MSELMQSCTCGPTRRCFVCMPSMFPRKYWEWAKDRSNEEVVVLTEKENRHEAAVKGHETRKRPTRCSVCGVPSFSNYCDACWSKSA